MYRVTDEAPGRAGPIGSVLARALLGGVGVPIYLLLGWLALRGAATWSGVAYVVLLGALLAAGIVRARRVTRGTLAGLVAVGAARAAWVGSGGLETRLETWGAQGDVSSARLVDRIVDEADVATIGARFVSDAEGKDLPRALADAYRAIEREEGRALPSPVVATALGLQRPSAFDVIVARPAGTPARAALVFLHGSGGGFVQPCRQMASIARPLGMTTVCPSTNVAAEWAESPGREFLAATIAKLRRDGIERFVLAGLSNGGIGASLVGPTLARGELHGLVLVSGVSPSAPPSGVPTLVVHGREDERVEVEDATTYVRRTGAEALVVDDAGHFVFLLRHEAVNARIRAFLEVLIRNGDAGNP